jgi:hypothetical protein
MGRRLKNFDLFVGIDWSGAQNPVVTKSIALAKAYRGDAAPVLEEGGWSRDKVASWLVNAAKSGKRILAGIDCNFGYSEIIGEKQFGADYTAKDLWAAVEAANYDHPNFFAGGYWTHKKHAAHFWTEGKRPDGFALPRRATEEACGQSGLGWPESPFKLIGPKQVGKGGLAGMRLITYLKAQLGPAVAIWPFEQHTDQAKLIITEIYPRLFLRSAGHGNAKIRDLSALNRVLEGIGSKPYPKAAPFTDHDADAIVSAAGLRSLCGTAKTVPESLSFPNAPRKTLEREGWIFGAGA